MYQKSKMSELTNEALNVLAQEKNRKGNATSKARYAQELLWERRIQVRENIVDDYEDTIDVYDEAIQDYLDFIDIVEFIR